MQFKIKHFGKLLKKTFKVWNAKDPFRESSIIAYYSIFSIPALLTIIIAVAGMFFGRDGVSGYIYQQLGATMGMATAASIRDMISKASATGNSVWATILGVATLLLGATGVFAQLQKSLNIIWEVKADPKKQNILETIKTRVFSFGLIVSIGFLLLISLVVTSMLSVLGTYLHGELSVIMEIVFNVINFLVSFGVIAVLFAMIYKVLPDAKIRWSVVWTGSILTAFLFVLGKLALGIYFGKADPGSAYGAAGSIVLMLLWVSYSTMAVFFGAEFTKIYSDFYDLPAAPSKIAVKDKGREK